MTPLRIVFMGTAEFACPSLAALCGHPDFQVVGVVTQPDRPKGRDLKLEPSAVKQTAERLNLPVFQPERVRHESALAMLKTWQPDLLVVAAYGQILPPALLQMPRWSCLNVHASILPKYRGAAPIQWVLINGEIETGVTIMKMDEGLDTGDILTQQITTIDPGDNAQTLHDRLAQLGARLLVSTISDYINGKITPRKQDQASASYARKITKEDGRLNWQLPARELWNRIRAFNPWPTAFTFLPAQPKSLLLKIWQAEIDPQSSGMPGEILQADPTGITIACGRQALRIQSLQREGKRRLNAGDFLAGCHLAIGQKLE